MKSLNGWSRRLTASETAPSVVLLLCLDVLGCKLPPPTPAETRVLVIGLDVSPSARPADRCAETESAVGAVLGEGGIAALDVMVLATGGDEREPVALIPWERFFPSERLYGDLDAESRERAGFAKQLGARCRKNFKASSRSPVFQMVKRGVEAVRGRCAEIARSSGTCARDPILIVGSDGRETEELAITQRLKGSKASSKPLPTLDTQGIRFTLCGYSQVVGAWSGDVDVVEIWRLVLGKGVVFNPVCAIDRGSEDSDAGDRTGGTP